MVAAPRIGVLGLQGGFAEHLRALRSCGLEAVDVRTAGQLAAVDALVIPGGESTTMLKLLDRFGLRGPLVERIGGGMGVFGTCAGAIVLASRSSDGEPPLGVLDVGVRRNAYGRQVESFEADVEVSGIGAVHGVFIRAPVFEETGPDVEVLAHLARNGGPASPVLVRSGRLLASAFHPELTGDLRLHRYFVSEVCGLAAG